MSEENPWKTHGSRLIYSNPWFSVREDSVTRPDGNPGKYSVVDTRIATGVVALDEDQNIYLVGQYRYPTNHYSWEIIEGGSEGAESALVCAKRELHEESGITAAEWYSLGDEFHLSNCFTSERGFVFLAKKLTLGTPNPDATEILALKKLPFAEALALVDSGEIKDGLSIVGLLRAERFLTGKASGKHYRLLEKSSTP
jgi:8-oxo-dGTP pyrophosphatase MutT (NUDIX family)